MRFNKKVMIPLGIVVLMGLASAMLVPYLTQKATVNAQVQSPFQFSVMNGNSNSVNFYSQNPNGEGLTINESLKNIANFTTTNYYQEILVTNPSGLSAGEFNMTYFDNTMTPGTIDYKPVLQLNSTTAVIFVGTHHDNLTAGQELNMSLHFNFAPNVIGNYHITTQIVNPNVASVLTNNEYWYCANWNMLGNKNGCGSNPNYYRASLPTTA